MIPLTHQETFESVFRFASIGMALVHPTGRWIRVNRSTCDLLGYSEAELLQIDFQTVTHPEDIDRDLTLLQELIAGTRESYQMEKRYLHKSKKIVWVLLNVSVIREKDGSPIYFISQIQDITERKESEMALSTRNTELRHQQTQLATVIESMNALVIEISPIGKIRNLWKKSPKPTFYTPWNLIQDESVYEGLPHALAEPISNAVLRTIVSHELQIIELKLTRPKSLWLQARVSPVLTEQKKVVSLILMISDISKLKKTQEQLIQSSKLSSLGEMAAGIAHEINNPLAIILGITQILKKNLSKKPAVSAEKTLGHVESIHTTAERIAAIVKGLRTFSRNAETDSKQETDIVSVIHDTLNLCQERFKNSGIKLELELLDSAVVFAKATQLSQVFLNLLTNADDAIKGLKEKWIRISLIETPEHYSIRFVDSGPGIDPEIIEKIMDPFFTTKSVGLGTGLGLSISKGIIEAHGGTLSYIQQVKNTTFEVLLRKK